MIILVKVKPIVLFDSYCSLCMGFVEFLLKKDKKRLQFAPLDSKTGKKLLKKFDIKDLTSIVLVEDKKYYRKSSAVMRILKNIGGLWSLLYVFIIIPPFIRDFFYEFIAHHRYRWFGKKKLIVTKEMKKRFLQ